MDSYYANMKQEMGLKERPDVNEEDIELDEVLHKLRPNTNAKNFKHFLKKKDNVNKNGYWKNVSRKVDKSGAKLMNASVIESSPYSD